MEFLGDKLDSQSLRGIFAGAPRDMSLSDDAEALMGVCSKCAKNETVCGAFISDSPSSASGAFAHVLTLVQEIFMFLGVSATSTMLYFKTHGQLLWKRCRRRVADLEDGHLTSSRFEQCTWPSNGG